MEEEEMQSIWEKGKECKTAIGFLVFYNPHMACDVFWWTETKPISTGFTLKNAVLESCFFSPVE